MPRATTTSSHDFGAAGRQRPFSAAWFLLAPLAAALLLFAAALLLDLYFARTIAAAGHTESPREREVLIGNNVLRVPENAIRFENARRDGDQPRLDLYLHWPDLKGYTQETRDDFNHVSGAKNIVFVSLAPRMLAQDMSERLQPMYRGLVNPGATGGPAGLVLHRFSSDSGYIDEVLVVGAMPQGKPFVARCLGGELSAPSLAPCERDLHFGEDLTLAYRFPEELLGEWRWLDSAVTQKMQSFLLTAE